MFTAVAPLAGAWIEIMSKVSISCVSAVAPLAGAWIEIAIADPLTNMRSVAPLAGAWIEIGSLVHPLWLLSRRSPRGSVD